MEWTYFEVLASAVVCCPTYYFEDHIMILLLVVRLKQNHSLRKELGVTRQTTAKTKAAVLALICYSGCHIGPQRQRQYMGLQHP